MPTRPLPLLLALAAPVAAQAPPAEWDQTAGKSLKDVHARGADLYLTDPAGAYRLYEGALLAVRPLLGHRPAAQKAIADGLADAAKAAGSAKDQAFRLHEAIEAVRAELKKPLPKAAETAKAPPPPRRPPPAGATERSVYGTVTLDGKPVGRVRVYFYQPDRGGPPPTGTTAADGTYLVTKDVPAGDYTMLFDSDASGLVPDKYKLPATSDVTAKVVEGRRYYDFDLKSK